MNNFFFSTLHFFSMTKEDSIAKIVTFFPRKPTLIQHKTEKCEKAIKSPCHSKIHPKPKHMIVLLRIETFCHE